MFTDYYLQRFVISTETRQDKCIVSDIIYIDLGVIKNMLVFIRRVLKQLIRRVFAMIFAVNQMSASKV